MVSRAKVYLAISTLCLVTIAWMVGVGVAPFSRLTMVGCLFLAIPCLFDFFPIYTLLKRKLIPYKIFVLTGLLLLILIAVFGWRGVGVVIAALIFAVYSIFKTLSE